MVYLSSLLRNNFQQICLFFFGQISSNYIFKIKLDQCCLYFTSQLSDQSSGADWEEEQSNLEKSSNLKINELCKTSFRGDVWGKLFFDTREWWVPGTCLRRVMEDADEIVEFKMLPGRICTKWWDMDYVQEDETSLSASCAAQILGLKGLYYVQERT